MKLLSRNGIHVNKLIPLFIVLLISILVPQITKSPYTLHIFIMWYIAIILGMSFSMIYSTGLITLGVAAFYGIGAYTSTLLVVEAGLPFWYALPVATIITGIIALGVGSIMIRTSTFAFVILTMLFNLAVVQIVGSISLLGGWGGFINIPCPEPIPFPAPIEFVTHVPYYYLILFLLLLILLTFHALYASRIGRVWQTIKQSSRLAETLGINVYRYRVFAFVVASSASGMVGSFYVHYFQVVYPDMFGGFLSIYIQIYAALGGLNFYMLGPAIGAAIMMVGPELLSIVAELRPIIFGVVLILIIIFFPGGILGTLQRQEIPAIYAKMGKTIRAWLSQ